MIHKRLLFLRNLDVLAQLKLIATIPYDLLCPEVEKIFGAVIQKLWNILPVEESSQQTNTFPFTAMKSTAKTEECVFKIQLTTES